MSLYNVGDLAELAFAVTDDTGAAIDPSSASLTVTAPDNTVATTTLAQLARVDVGQYIASVPLLQQGVHRWRWQATGGGASGATGQLQSGTSLVTLDEVRDELNYPASDHSDDTELCRFALAATEVAELIGGWTVPRSTTEVHDGGSPIAVLRRSVVAVTAVVEYLAQMPYVLALEPLGGSSFTQYGYTVDGPILTRRSFGTPYPFVPGRGNVVITYTAGAALLPERVRMRALELVRHWFQQGQQQNAGGIKGASYQYSDDAVQSVSKLGNAIPTRVVQLLGADRQIAGIGRAPTTADAAYNGLLTFLQAADLPVLPEAQNADSSLTVQIIDTDAAGRIPNVYVALLSILNVTKQYAAMAGGDRSPQQESYEIHGEIRG